MNTHYTLKRLRMLACGLAALAFTLTPSKALAQLSGSSYTIDANQAASSTNYRNFQSFFNDIWNGTRTDGGMRNGPGISAAVEVNVAANQTFTEQVTVNPNGTLNANRRVTIKGNNALLTFNANTTNRHTIWMNGADFYTFDGLRIEGTNNTFAYTVRLSNQADYNIFRNCTISAPNINYTGAVVNQLGTMTTQAFTNTTSAAAIVAFVSTNNNLANTTAANNGRGNLFESNILTGPSDGATIAGPTFGVFEQGNTSTLHGENEFIGNEIKNVSGCGIFSVRSSGGKYNNNKVSQKLTFNYSTTHRYYGIWIHYPNLTVHNKNIEIIGNQIVENGRANGSNFQYFYGIATGWTNSSSTLVNTQNNILIEKNIVANNYYFNTGITTGWFYGIYANYAAKAHFINNIVANNRMFDLGGSTRTNYYYPIFHNYSRGGSVVHNTAYSNIQMPTLHRVFDYGIWAFSCCDNNTTTNDLNKISVLNNISYSNFRRTGSNSNDIYNYSNYFYYITEVRNNAFFGNTTDATFGNSDAYYFCRVGRSTQCITNSWNFPADNDNQDITGNIRSNAQFVNPNNLDFNFTSPELNATALRLNTSNFSWLPTSVFEDFNGNPRNINNPDIGAIEVNFDYAISGEFNNGDYSLCGGETRPMTATVRNLMPFNLNNPRIGYRLNNNPIVFKTADVLPANGNIDITFDEDVNLTGASENSVLKVFIAHADDNNANDTLTFNITIGRGPYGGSLTVNQNTKGLAPTSERAHWITIPGDPIIFNMSNPSNYGNNRHGIDYQAFASARTINSNITLPASSSVYTHNSVTGGTWTINPPEAFVDSMIEIQLRIRDNNTGCDTFVVRQVLVAPFGKPDFKVPANICVGNTIEIENEATVQSGYLEYEWDFGNGVTSKQTNGQPTFMAPGTYQVTLKTTTVPYGFVKSISKTVTVNAGPIADFEFESRCFGSPVVLTNTTTSSVGTPTYSWNFGNGQTSTAANPTISYTTPGQYTVTLTAQRNGCVTTMEKSVAQFEQPVADFNLNSGSCQNAPFAFDNLTGNVSGKVGYLWHFGENNRISTQVEGHHTYATSGSKTVKLVVTTALGCKDSITKNIMVIPGPAATFSINGQCQNADINFTSLDIPAVGQNPVYTWNIDGQNFATQSANIQYQTVGTRNAHLTVAYANGCQNSTMKSFQILPAPVADFNADLVCAGQEVILDNRTTWTDGAISYTWNLGDGNSSNTTHASHVYATAGNVNVTLTAEIIGGCSAQVSKTITVNPAPSRCDFIANQDFANGFRNFTFVPTDGNNKGTETGVNYTWYYGDGTQGSDNNRDYAIDGAFTVTMRAETSAGCFCESTQQVVVDRLNNELIGNQDQFVVYPSPNNGNFTISLAEQSEGTIEISDAVGNILYTTTAKAVKINNGQVNLKGLSSGIYFVRYNSPNQTTVRKMQVIE